MNLQIIVIVVFVLITILTFYLARSIILWYFKIDKKMALLEKNNELLQKILDK